MSFQRRACPIVLTVDDDEAVRTVARRVLELEGYAVKAAPDGPTAIAMLNTGAELDLLIADLNMPGMIGEEMVRQIRVTRPDLKVLYLTGYIDRLMDKRQLWEGEAFLEKPFSFAGLSEAVSLLLHGTIRRR